MRAIAPEQVTTRSAVSPQEAAHMLGVSRVTIYNLIKRGELTRYKIGRSTKLNTAQVLSLVGAEPDTEAVAR
jgi:excisionase family DNA binding protein